MRGHALAGPPLFLRQNESGSGAYGPSGVQGQSPWPSSSCLCDSPRRVPRGRMLYVLLVGVAFLAGAQNALAGGGSFLTFPALLAAGLGVRAANITSTVALFPGQIATGWSGRAHVEGLPGLSVRTLAVIGLAGGAAGAVLL